MSNRIPTDLMMSRNDLVKANESSRWAIELEKISMYATDMDYELRGNDGNILGIEYTVQIDLESTKQNTVSEVRLRLIIPEDYPNSMPRIYPVDMHMPFDHKAHLYRDRKNRTHLCIMKQDDWTTDCTLVGMMVLSSFWVHKYIIWKNTGTWPGRSRHHCPRCGKIGGCEHN